MPNIADSLGLLIGVVVIATIADRVRIPYPILMVVVGVGVALVPTHHRVALPPNLILLVFLPPLIYDASLETSLEEIRAQLRPILLLAVGLVVATMTVVAVVIHQLVPGTSWAVAFTLGAVVSPPDSIAATQIAGKLGLPRSLTTILGGEGLMNDATALTAYQLAVAAVATGFTVADVIGRFAFAVVAGVAIGLGVGWAISRLLRLIETPVIENTLLLVLPFAAYLPADELKASGVLAVVAAGLFFGRYGSTSLSPAARLQQHQIWDLIVFLLTGLSFLLVGLELREVLDSLTNRESGSLVLESLAVVGAVIGVRLVWIFGASVLPRRFRLLGPGPPGTTWRQSRGSGVGRDAGGGEPGRRPRPSHHLPRPGPGRLPHLRSHRGHPGRPGPDPPAADPATWGGVVRRPGHGGGAPHPAPPDPHRHPPDRGTGHLRRVPVRRGGTAASRLRVPVGPDRATAGVVR